MRYSVSRNIHVLAELGGELVEAGVRVADEAVGELARVVAGIGVIEAGRTFEHRLAAADLSLLRQRDGEHGVAHGGALAQRAAFEVAARQVRAQRDRARAPGPR